VARQTELGRRLATWIDDLPAATSGDEAAVRRVVAGTEHVRRATAEALKLRFGAADWLTSPETYVFRPPR
jgi:hypothetical protein